jgi:hypothetical protein
VLEKTQQIPMPAQVEVGFEAEEYHVVQLIRILYVTALGEIEVH